MVLVVRAQGVRGEGKQSEHLPLTNTFKGSRGEIKLKFVP